MSASAPQPATALPPAGEIGHITLMGLPLARLTEADTNQHVIDSLQRGQGGWICPVNLDVLRQCADSQDVRELVTSADLVVADGMPLVWASRLRGTTLPERVAGSSLIVTLSEQLGRHRHSMYLLGGNDGTAAAAGAKLGDMYPGVQIAGSYCPPFGFEKVPGELQAIEARLESAQPDVVFVGLGFPKQDRLIAQLKAAFPNTWFVSCGISFSFVVGEVRRAPGMLQRLGLEWVHRLVQEPRRLAHRYLVHGPPFALRLLAESLYARIADGV